MKINKTYDRNQIRHLDYSFNETPFGEVLAAWNDRGICAIPPTRSICSPAEM